MIKCVNSSKLLIIALSPWDCAQVVTSHVIHEQRQLYFFRSLAPCVSSPCGGRQGLSSAVSRSDARRASVSHAGGRRGVERSERAHAHWASLAAFAAGGRSCLSSLDAVFTSWACF